MSSISLALDSTAGFYHPAKNVGEPRHNGGLQKGHLSHPSGFERDVQRRSRTFPPCRRRDEKEVGRSSSHNGECRPRTPRISFLALCPKYIWRTPRVYRSLQLLSLR